MFVSYPFSNTLRAMRSGPSTIVKREIEAGLGHKLEGTDEFFQALVRRLPGRSSALDDARRGVGGATTGALRDVLGGDIALRGVGMAVFAHAFTYAREHDAFIRRLSALHLQGIDWHVLRCERADLLARRSSFPSPPPSKPMSMSYGNSLLIVGSNRYRISSES